ncbi:MAG: phosphoribosylamine--glycine ligase [Propionibacteriaceae bacterium]|nr:phosphoribosylamine--glycine ligase [Propionibacteriaceae bacterium]
MQLTVLVVGAGGREHALAAALARDVEVVGVHVAPGNPGTWDLSASYGVDHASDLGQRISHLDPFNPDAVVDLALDLGVNLVVIGPEAPLVAGVADQVREAGILCFGPSAQAAQLEGSKNFAKQVMASAGVPTAASRFCEELEDIESALDEFGAPYVVKDDALAAGKGVVVTMDRDVALAHAKSCSAVVIEEYLDGPEVSLFAICDGVRALPLLPAQDFKRVGDGDTGPNTGGMGAYCPLPWAPPELTDMVMAQVITPTLAEMERRGAPFQGLLYAGLALTSRGLRVVEFNVRFGDPETEAILPLLDTGLGRLLFAAAMGSLEGIGSLTWKDDYSLVIVYAAQGYPGTPSLDGSITIPPSPESVQVIHCGTALGSDGCLKPNSGRVLGIVAQGEDLGKARDGAYSYITDIGFPTGFYRRDIAEKAANGMIPIPNL